MRQHVGCLPFIVACLLGISRVAAQFPSLKKIGQAIKDKDVSKDVGKAFKDADVSQVRDVIKDSPLEAIKDAEPEKAVGSSREAKAAVQNTIKALDVRVVDGDARVKPPEATPNITTVTHEAQGEHINDEHVDDIQNVAKDTDVGRTIKGVLGNLSPKDIKGSVKQKSAKDLSKELLDTVKKTNVTDLKGKFSHAASTLGEDAKKMGEVVQDATGKEMVEAVKGATPQDADPKAVAAVKDGSKKFLDTAKGAAENVNQENVDSIFSKQDEALQNAKPKDLVGTVSDLKGKVAGVAQSSAGEIVDQLSDTAKGISKDKVVDLAKNPSKDKLVEALGMNTTLSGSVQQVPSSGTSAPEPPAEVQNSFSSFWTVVVVLMVLAGVVGLGYTVFNKLTKPKHVGMPMLGGDDSGLDGGNMRGRSNPWMGIGNGAGMRDVHQSTGFSRF